MGNIVFQFIFTDNTELIEEMIAIEAFSENDPFKTCNKETNCRQLIYQEA